MTESLVFLSGKRTAFGSFGGSLKALSPTDLALFAAKSALDETGLDTHQIDHVLFGNVLYSSKDTIYLPRHIGLKLGIPQSVPALGLNRLCGTGFQVIIEAFYQMNAGDTKIALIGGVENMSMTPYASWNIRWGNKMGTLEMSDLMTEALIDSYVKAPMAITAENLASKYSISRVEADEFALRSQKLALKATQEGFLKKEIAPIKIQDRKGKEIEFSMDEHLKPDSTLEGLGKLKPVFKKDGVVTAGNASGIVDGAAALIVATEKEASKLKLKPLGRLVSYGISGCDPTIMGIGPVPASQQALKRAGLSIEQMNLVEVNEAFAPQALAVEKELQIPREVFNVNGGAIAIGHPLAASGTRIVTHLLYELKRRKKRYALGSACIGGGQGIAVILESY